MVAGARLASDGAVHTSGLEEISSSRAQKKVVDP
jgi:hypothetical protein